MSDGHTTLTAGCAVAIAVCSLLVAAADLPGGKPGDKTMTCQQIAAELSPYMQQIAPNAAALAASGQEAQALGKRQLAAEMPTAIGMTAAATASAADPSGLSGKALGQAEMIHQREVWERSMAETGPLAEKMRAQTDQLVAQSQQLQSNARLERLLQLAAEKHCDGN
jgi:hypothetical protein